MALPQHVVSIVYVPICNCIRGGGTREREFSNWRIKQVLHPPIFRRKMADSSWKKVDPKIINAPLGVDLCGISTKTNLAQIMNQPVTIHCSSCLRNFGILDFKKYNSGMDEVFNIHEDDDGVISITCYKGDCRDRFYRNMEDELVGPPCSSEKMTNLLKKCKWSRKECVQMVELITDLILERSKENADMADAISKALYHLPNVVSEEEEESEEEESEKGRKRKRRE